MDTSEWTVERIRAADHEELVEFLQEVFRVKTYTPLNAAAGPDGRFSHSIEDADLETLRDIATDLFRARHPRGES